MSCRGLSQRTDVLDAIAREVEVGERGQMRERRDVLDLIVPVDVELAEPDEVLDTGEIPDARVGCVQARHAREQLAGERLLRGDLERRPDHARETGVGKGDDGGGGAFRADEPG